MAVDITTTPTTVVGKPRKLFEGPYTRSTALWPNYDVSPDGQRSKYHLSNSLGPFPIDNHREQFAIVKGFPLFLYGNKGK